MIFRNIASFVIATTSVLAISACTPQGPNQWIPKGYTYQDDTPITSPAPSSPWVKEAEITNTDALADNTAAWQGATFELLDGLSSVLSSNGSPIYVKQIAPVTNQDLALDHYVRQALIAKNVTLTTSENIAPVLWLDAQPLTQKNELNVVRNADMKGMFTLTAKLVAQDGTVLGENTTTALLPHEKTEYSRLPGYTTLPVAGLSTDQSPIYNK